MKENQIRQNNPSQVAHGKSFCTGYIKRMHKDQNLGTYFLNLFCIQSNLPVSLHTSKAKGPHLQNQVSKLIILLPSTKSKGWGFFVFFKASVKRNK